MRITKSYIYALILLWAFAACTNEVPEPVEETATLQLRAMGMPIQTPMTRSPFTVDGSRYQPYSEMYPAPLNTDYTTIGCFLVNDGQNTYDKVSGNFKYKNANEWTSSVSIKPGDYYIFAFMPSNESSQRASVKMREGSDTWADGAEIVVEGIQTVTPADVCVSVGVLKGTTEKLPIDNETITSQLQQGVYAYEGTVTDNYVYLILDHLYTNVNLELSLNPEYAKLRTIVLTEVYMKSNISPTATATIKLGKEPTKPIEDVKVVYDSGTSYTMEATLFKADPMNIATTGIRVSDDADYPTSVPGYFAPGMTTQAFEFEFHYNVYDKQGEDLSDPLHPVYGNLVRKNAIAINKWSLQGQQVTAGKSFKVPATVKPTYLYMLSEPDLDNPTIVLQ